MNTQAQVHSLVAGQALPLPRRSATLVLTEGELLVQRPAGWIGETLIVRPALRLSAPALVPANATAIVAIGAARLTVHEAQPALPAWLVALAARLRHRRVAVPA